MSCTCHSSSRNQDLNLLPRPDDVRTLYVLRNGRELWLEDCRKRVLIWNINRLSYYGLEVSFTDWFGTSGRSRKNEIKSNWSLLKIWYHNFRIFTLLKVEFDKSYRIIDSFPRILKWKILRLKPVYDFFIVFVGYCL